MIEEIKCYKCKYCDCVYETRESAIDCLENHNLVYMIQKYISSHDCWGKAEGDYEDTTTVFKNYDKAENYVKYNKDTRIKCVALQ